MANRRVTALLVFVLLGTAIGCGSNRVVSDADLDAGTDAGVPPVTVGGTVLDNEGTPVLGAKVCLSQPATAPCSFSDESGAYSMQIPGWTTEIDMAVSATADGYLGFTGLLHQSPADPELGAGVTWFATMVLTQDSAATQLLATQAGFIYPASGKGFLGVSVFHGSGGGFVGQTLTLLPSAETIQEPIYVDPSGIPTPALDAITANGYAFFGDLSPGPVEVTTGAPCMPVRFSADGWADDKADTVAAIVVSGTITSVAMICED